MLYYVTYHLYIIATINIYCICLCIKRIRPLFALSRRRCYYEPLSPMSRNANLPRLATRRTAIRPPVFVWQNGRPHENPPRLQTRVTSRALKQINRPSAHTIAKSPPHTFAHTSEAVRATPAAFRVGAIQSTVCMALTHRPLCQHQLAATQESGR